MVDSTYKELLDPLRSLCTQAVTQPAQLRQHMRTRSAEEQRQWDGFDRLLEPLPPAPR
jgi:hypothetical protein